MIYRKHTNGLESEMIIILAINIVYYYFLFVRTLFIQNMISSLSHFGPTDQSKLRNYIMNTSMTTINQKNFHIGHDNFIR